MAGIVTRLFALLLITWVCFGCTTDGTDITEAVPPVYESRILRLYDQLEVGTSRIEAEMIVGEPLSQPNHWSDRGFQCLYIDTPERQMEPHESPWSYAGIVVEYDADGRHIEARYNSQWVKEEDRGAYER
ncbi:MAG: hypothetical protein AAGC44_10760 [Planctomycetota bacterium]